jgi:hypothetical protein
MSTLQRATMGLSISPTAVTILTAAMTIGTIAHAYYYKQQFYPTVVYLTKSNPSLAVCFVAEGY